ncbi:MAG: flagellar hook-basal body complex protein [Desulfovibrionaceae bacterium]|nr:flagellar hook-basal body complex protein [Desulfovibrionaceae bacterium]
MLSSLYIGATGMKSQSVGMNVIGNNLANCSTVGFKAQMALYADLISQNQANPGEWTNNQQDSIVAVGQVGRGVGVDDIATNFTQGGFESTNNTTDLAINGRGYFALQDESGSLFYTRAGDFTLDSNAVMRSPGGLALAGVNLSRHESAKPAHTYPSESDASEVQEDVAAENETSSDNAAESATPPPPPVRWDVAELTPITLDKFTSMEASATTSLDISDVNIPTDAQSIVSNDNPYFSLLSHYNATHAEPLDSSVYSNSQALTLYDSEGTAHEVAIYYDGRTVSAPNSAAEFLIAETVNNAETAGSGALMSGMLLFDEQGQLAGLSAYTPTEPGNTDLSTWSTANLSDYGLPTFSLTDDVPITLDFGIRSQAGWTSSGTADQVGTDLANLSLLADSETASTAATAYNNEAFMASHVQNGYGEGVLSSYEITTDGIVKGTFSNGEMVDMWQIPIARFTSEYGLDRAGDNLFVQTAEAGTMELGSPTNENFGTVISHSIEQSNVDLSKEMVTMIVTQRGFQSNSKVVTTSDELLRTAINLKR